MITLGGLLADTPHTRPVPVTGTADGDMAERLGLSRSSYEGPTGIVGVVHDVCRDESIPSASLWAAVPHYISVSPNPKAALALIDRLGAMLETRFDTMGSARPRCASSARCRLPSRRTTTCRATSGTSSAAPMRRRAAAGPADGDELAAELHKFLWIAAAIR